MFKDRKDAGKRLATALAKYKNENPVVVAIPRGGVPVAYEVAVALEAPLEIMVVRKLGAPGEPELGIGAVVDGDHPQGVLNEQVMAALGISQEYLDRELARQLKEINRRQEAYRLGRSAVSLEGRSVIVVDDGIATGGSMRAALRGVRRAKPKRLVLAVPVSPEETIESLRPEVDEVVCLSTPVYFGAIGEFYADFSQTSDAQVTALLDAACQRASIKVKATQA